VGAELRKHLTYANVISTLCLFIVLGGTSWAVASGSIGSREIKDGSVLSKDIRNGQVSGADVDNGSLGTKDFAKGKLPTGPRGATGPQGPAGPAGATNVVIRSSDSSCPGGGCAGFLTRAVLCEAGERAVGGGASMVQVNDGIPHPVASDNLTFSGPTDSSGKLVKSGTPTGWLSTLQQGNSPQDRVTTFYAICASP
jgi:hypothetical protein